MMFTKPQIPVLLAGFVLIMAMCATHAALDQLRERNPVHQRFMYLPDGGLLRTASLGFREFVSDVIWLQIIQATGEKRVSQEAGQWISQALDVVTTLDPTFVSAYEIGGIVLCTVVNMPEASNRILEKGMRHNPEVWRLPFLLGINQYFEFGDDARAAEYMTKAAQLPGAPSYVPQVAAGLLVSAKAPQQALELLAKVYEETSDPNVRTLLERRLKETIVERDLQALEQAIGRYQAELAKRPLRLEEVVHQGLLRTLPVEPFAGQYLYDPISGTVRSSEVRERTQARRLRRSQHQEPAQAVP